MKKKFFGKILTLSMAGVCLFTSLIGCSSGQDDQTETDSSVLLHLNFDEGKGNTVTSIGSFAETSTVRYELSSGYAQDPQDPQWRSIGIKKGSLLFDGYSNYIQYSYDDIILHGKRLSIEAWVAPRVFESNETGYRERGNEMLTAIVSQHSTVDNSGVILGIHREGNVCFQLGVGDRTFKCWADGKKISKYEWSKISAVFDGENGVMKVYINGVQYGETKFFKGAEIAEVAEPLLIGKNNEYSSVGSCARQMFSGLMDEVKIYNRSLSDSDVKTNYQKDVPNGIPTINFDDIWFDESILVNDTNRQTYHYMAPNNWMNEAHAPIYYNGMYHLFYQFSPMGPYLQQPHWGHWVSTDMVSWKSVKEALSPTDDGVCRDGVWAGGAGYRADGTPVLFVTTSDLSRSYGKFSDQNVAIAMPTNTSDKYLLDWKMSDTLAVAQAEGQGKACGFRDTTVWKVGDTWYLGVGSASSKHAGGTMQVYSTKDDSFMNWTYRGEIMDTVYPESILGPLWELPNMVPIKNEDGTDSGKYIFLISPCPPASNNIVYWIGTFDTTTCKFIPDAGYETPKRIDYGKNFKTGPSAMQDPVTGATVLFTVGNNGQTTDANYQSGWAHGSTLTTELTLDSNNELVIKPLRTYSNLHKEELLSVKNVTVAQVNDVINQNKVGGRAIRIHLKMQSSSAAKFGINVRKSADGSERAQVYYENGVAGLNCGLSGSSNAGVNYHNLTVNDGIVEFDIFLDNSLVEVIYNNKFMITNRIFPKVTSVGLEVFADGSAKVLEMQVYSMKSLYSDVGYPSK